MNQYILFFKFQNTVVDCLEEGDHDKEVQENLRPYNQQLTKVKTEVCLRLKLHNKKCLEVHLFQMLDSINIVEPYHWSRHLSLTLLTVSDHIKYKIGWPSLDK